MKQPKKKPREDAIDARIAKKCLKQIRLKGIMKPKKKPTHMPKVWGRKPSFHAYGFTDNFFGCARLERGYEMLVLETDAGYPTEAAALRAIRKLWIETFGGGK